MGTRTQTTTSCLAERLCRCRHRAHRPGTPRASHSEQVVLASVATKIRKDGKDLQSETISTDTFKRHGDGTYRGWVICTGIALVVLGATAIAHDVSATVVSVFLLG